MSGPVLAAISDGAALGTAIAALITAAGGVAIALRRLPGQQKLDEVQSDAIVAQVDGQVWARVKDELSRSQTQNTLLVAEVDQLRHYVEVLRWTIIRNGMQVPHLPAVRSLDSAWVGQEPPTGTAEGR